MCILSFPIMGHMSYCHHFVSVDGQSGFLSSLTFHILIVSYKTTEPIGTKLQELCVWSLVQKHLISSWIGK
jgi:hypothetical protein